MTTRRDMVGVVNEGTYYNLVGARLVRGEQAILVKEILALFDAEFGNYTATASRLGITRRYLLTVITNLGIRGQLQRIAKRHSWMRAMWERTESRYLHSPLLAARARGNREEVKAMLLEAIRQGGSYAAAGRILGVSKVAIFRYVRSLEMLTVTRREIRRYKAIKNMRCRLAEKTMKPKNVCELTILKAQGKTDELRTRIVDAINESEGNLSAAARTLGVSLNTVHRYVKELALEPVVDTARGDGGASRSIGREAVSRRG